jgi:ABC-type antimicrobial peptide transport system permease subunit
MAVLGIILIYSLLMGKVEEKTYEYGMLRALGKTHPIKKGMKKTSLIHIMITQSFYFAIPGICLAMFFSWLCGIGVDYIFVFISKPPILMLNWTAILYPVLLGIFIPLIANIIPIRVFNI